MEGRTPDRNALREGLQVSAEGTGPLVQHDYWCVVRGCRFAPEALMAHVREHFAEFPPAELADFERREGGGALEPGDEMRIRLPGAGMVGVRVIHMDARSMTVATLEGHPIAGRITFGAYPNERGDVIFHIRSRARNASLLHYLGHRVVGEPMQSTTWTDFLDRLAHSVGEGVVGVIHEETREVPEEAERRDALFSPTFVAEGE